MHQNSCVYVAGHTGLVGSAILRALRRGNYGAVVTRPRRELDLTNREAVSAFLNRTRPDYVLLCAARVGGILDNASFPADFIRDNLAIQCNVMDASYRAGVRNLLFFGSSSIYPRECPQPIREDALLAGPLEPSNRPYALAKIAGIEMCWAYNRQYGTRYLAVMPCNLYGPDDHFDLERAHVLPALLRKAHLARQEGQSHMEVWGSGTPRRELLHADDLAAACLHLMTLPEEWLAPLFNAQHPPMINAGAGTDVSIAELARLAADAVGFAGELRFDPGKPDGTPQKLMDSSRMRALGWEPKIPLHEGVQRVYEQVRVRL